MKFSKIFDLMKKIKQLQDLIENELYFKSGDTYHISGHQVGNGYLTSGKTRVFFNIDLPKRMDKVQPSITKLVGSIRVSTGGYIYEDATNLLSFGKIDIWKNGNVLTLRYTMNEASSYGNNILASVDIQEAIITFD